MPPDYAKVRREALAEAIVVLKIRGVVQPLVSADDLAAILGVTPTDVRDALRRLKKQALSAARKGGVA